MSAKFTKEELESAEKWQSPVVLLPTEDVRALYTAIDELLREFRDHDLPYGSAAYQRANSLLNP